MKELIKMIKKKGIKFERGLSAKEIDKIERLYDIHFPHELKEMFMYALPVSNGFYNWKDYSNPNVEFIKKVMNMPTEAVRNDTEDIEWGISWGEEPNNPEVRAQMVLEKLESAPKLIPLYTHRYIVSSNEKQSPVFSIHGTDIICYGETLEQYLKNEFIHQDCYVNLDKIPDCFWKDVL